MQPYIYIYVEYNIYIYTHTYLHRHIHIYSCVCASMFLQIYMYTCIHSFIHTSIFQYTPTYLHTYILPTYLPTNPSPCRTPPSLCFPGGSRAVPTFAVTGGDGDAARPEDLRVASAGGGAAMAVEGSKTLKPPTKAGKL